jgi:hypothetical protein
MNATTPWRRCSTHSHLFAQHSQADVIITLTNVANGEHVVREVFGESVVVVPYAMPASSSRARTSLRAPAVKATAYRRRRGASPRQS